MGVRAIIGQKNIDIVDLIITGGRSIRYATCTAIQSLINIRLISINIHLMATWAKTKYVASLSKILHTQL